MPEDIVRVFRVVECVGPRSKVEEQIRKSIHGTTDFLGDVRVTAVTMGEFPELIRVVPVGGPAEDAHVQPDRQVREKLREEWRRLQDNFCKEMRHAGREQTVADKPEVVGRGQPSNGP